MSGSIRQVTITGRVQGVGYRAWVEDRAKACGVQGWARNRRDGSVEAVFGGPAELVSEMIASCWRGPSSARVDAVREEDANPDALNLRRAGERFSVLPTI
jgi:acylphosphatase